MILILPLLVMNFLWAQTVSVPWNCPQNGKNVSLGIPDTANVTVQLPNLYIPDFSYIERDVDLRDTTVNYGQCISTFLHNANQAFETYRATCATTTPQPPGCTITPASFEASVFSTFDRSWLVTRNRDVIRFQKPSLEPAAANLAQQIANGNPPDLMNFSGNYDFNGVSTPLSEFGPQVRDELLRQMDAKSPEIEQRKFIDDFAYANHESLQSIETIRASCTSELDCARKLKTREEVLFTLRHMLQRVYAASEIQGRLNTLCSAPQTGPGENLEDILDSLRKSSCRRDAQGNYPMNVNEYRFVQRNRAGADYLLRRTDQGYEAMLNVNFSYTDGAIAAGEMRQKAQECLSLANEHMRGPDNTPLRIRIMTDAEAQTLPGKKPRPVNINLQRLGWRSHAATYSSRVDCDTIVHETLHLLRLVDEYKEGNLDAGACRVVVQSDSIMAQSQTTFNETVPRELKCECTGTCQTVMSGTDEVKKNLYTSQTLIEMGNYNFYSEGCPANAPARLITSATSRRRVSAEQNPDGSVHVVEIGFFANGNLWEKDMQCRCPAGKPECEAGKRRLLQNAATPPRVTQNCPAGGQIRSRYLNEPVPTNYNNGVLSIGTRPRYSNLLYPSHFQKIIAGECTDRLRGTERPVYDQCSEFAYAVRSSDACSSSRQAERENCERPGVFTGAVQPQ